MLSIGLNYCNADQNADEIYTYFYQDKENGPKARLLQNFKLLDESQNGDDFLIIEKDIQIKDGSDRNILLNVSSDLDENKTAYAKIVLDNLHIDSSLEWSGVVELSRTKSKKYCFPLKNKCDSFEIYGSSIEFKRISDTKFEILIPKTRLIKNIEFVDKSDTVVNVNPIEESKDIFNNRIMYFNHDNVNDLKLMVEAQEPDGKPIENLNISIEVKPHGANLQYKSPLFESFNLFCWSKQQGNNFIVMSPVLNDAKIIRDEKFIKLVNDKKEAVLARFGIFKAPFTNQLLVLGIEGRVDGISLYIDSIIKMQENTDEKIIDLKVQGAIPNPPQIILKINK